jgi:hypothetical protein
MAEATIEQNTNNQRIIKPLRTYEDDVARFVKNKKISTSQIMMAEKNRALNSKKSSDKTPKSPKDKKAFWIMMSIILVIAGLAIALFAYIFFNPSTGIVNFNSGPQDLTDALIDKKEEVVIDSTGKVALDVKTAVINSIKQPPFLADGEIAEIKIVKDVFDPITQKNVKDRVPTYEALDFMELDIPDRAVRSFDESEYLIGLIGTNDRQTPFILIRVTDVDLVLSGMLSWETSMFRDVNDFFFEKLPTGDFVTGNANSNLTNLTDGVISNRDARAIVDSQGSVLFYYTFVNDDHILLGERTEIVSDIATKLNLRSLVR